VIWTLTSPASLETALRAYHADPPPNIYELVPPEKLHLPPISTVWSGEFHEFARSGGFDLLVDDEHIQAGLALGQSVGMELAGYIDPERDWFRWEDQFPGLDAEERPGPHMIDEWVSVIDDTKSIGPGGRVKASRRSKGGLVEVMVRGRGRSLTSQWRDLAPIVGSVMESAEDSPGVRIRFAFGYHESSKYEHQQWLRPAFVSLLDQPSLDEGIRWRIAIVQAATETPELPPDAGLEGALGDCG
jgi:hypothetical protein